MEARSYSWKRLFTRMGLATAALSGFLMFVGPSSTQANEYYDCQRRIERAERKLDEAIYHHGYYSHQARRRREELEEQRARCYAYGEHRRYYRYCDPY